MAGYGTGIPLYFNCPNYRRLDWRTRTSRDAENHRVVRTGRTKPRRWDGNQGLRTLDTAHEYRCRCGHVGWTTHCDIESAPLARR